MLEITPHYTKKAEKQYTKRLIILITIIITIFFKATFIEKAVTIVLTQILIVKAISHSVIFGEQKD